VEDALVATGFPSRRRHQNVNVHFFYQLAMLSHGVRRPGAAALDLAYVACGRLDLFWEFHLKPWDIAAGILMIQEAGGCVRTCVGARSIYLVRMYWAITVWCTRRPSRCLPRFSRVSTGIRFPELPEPADS
jgi:fructose-1,6-bisphosphatase/inositol monophosphatase family enzyme